LFEAVNDVFRGFEASRSDILCHWAIAQAASKPEHAVLNKYFGEKLKQKSRLPEVARQGVSAGLSGTELRRRVDPALSSKA
jgi:hypothetical protein